MEVWPPLQHRQFERNRDEPLLRAVVQVALDPATLPVARLNDPVSRRHDLSELRSHLGTQSLVLDGHPGSRAGGADETFVESRVVDQGRQPFAVGLDERGYATVAAGISLRQRHRSALCINPAV